MLNIQTYHLPGSLSDSVQSTLSAWQHANNVERLWSKDASLWTSSGEENWLGWLLLESEARRHVEMFARFAGEIRAEGFTDVVVLGMGGSSLFPEVMARTFGHIQGWPRLQIVDSTDPRQIKAVEKSVNLDKTLFIVASKSGTTLEPNIFMEYFYDRVRQRVGEEKAGLQFAAVTDPDSKLEKEADERNFRGVFFGDPTVGGRFSALSPFGLVPAAAMGVHLTDFLDRTAEMVRACGVDQMPAENPGVILGAILGEANRQGRDKLTIVASPGIEALGAWLEQLIAESTGKNGEAIIPIDLEPLAAPETYSTDRVFVYLRLVPKPDRDQERAVDAIEQAGFPVVRISVLQKENLGQEIYRWEIATAVAGAIMGINPFNQPDVEASKIATKRMMQAYEDKGKLPQTQPILTGDGMQVFSGGSYQEQLTPSLDGSISGLLRAHLDTLSRGDYFALLAYVPMNEATDARLQTIRRLVLENKRIPTAVGFGPRFLHSTGQAYKGGPNSGVFVTITCDDDPDLPVPGANYTFGIVKLAQAMGDFEVLADRGRRAIRIHLPANVEQGLKQLQTAFEEALS